MEDALRNIMPLQQLRVLSFTDYEHQLPMLITEIKQVSQVSLSTINIGDNDLSNTNWETVNVIGDHIRFINKPMVKSANEGQCFLSISKIKTLRKLNLSLYSASDFNFIPSFTQISQLKVDGVNRRTNELINQIGKLKNIHSLSLNFLADAPISLYELRDLENLTTLIISTGNSLNEPSVERLDILPRFRNLETLSLNMAKIIDFPDVFSQLTRLKSVSLPFNKLTRLPLSLFNLPLLQHLNVASNQLTTLPFALSYGAVNLKQLDLRHNQINTLPEALISLTKLETINLSENELTTVPRGWESLENLKEADFSSNDLKEFPNGLQDNHYVEKINVWVITSPQFRILQAMVTG